MSNTLKSNGLKCPIEEIRERANSSGSKNADSTFVRSLTKVVVDEILPTTKSGLRRNSNPENDFDGFFTEGLHHGEHGINKRKTEHR